MTLSLKLAGSPQNGWDPLLQFERMLRNPDGIAASALCHGKELVCRSVQVGSDDRGPFWGPICQVRISLQGFLGCGPKSQTSNGAPRQQCPTPGQSLQLPPSSLIFYSANLKLWATRSVVSVLLHGCLGNRGQREREREHVKHVFWGHRFCVAPSPLLASPSSRSLFLVLSLRLPQMRAELPALLRPKIWRTLGTLGLPAPTRLHLGARGCSRPSKLLVTYGLHPT